MPDPLLQALEEHFGFRAFRGQQEAVIRHVLGGADALVIMPTGEGKSLCYQLPALVQDGVTLVVSPLIALMEDQTQALRKKGIAAACIHSLLSKQDREKHLAAALAGAIKLLYVTPERFRVGPFLERIREVSVALLAIDEAHCLSQWGHDFRPDYSRLGEVREALGAPPTLALTATATPAVQQDILGVLGVPDARTFHTGLERPNLFLSVHKVQVEEDKIDRVLEVIEEVGGPGIVYHALIRDLLRTEEQLLRRGFQPLVYHGDLSASERKEQQGRFIDSPDGVILATNAFGMGVDKPDIRFIVHYQMPRTLEAYYQEIGRAGRDGTASLCELIYFEPDVSIQREFTEWANPDQDFLLQIVDYLEGLGERVQAIDAQTLRETFLIKNRRDGRIETCLRLLDTAGCTTGDLGKDFRWVRRPTGAEVDAWLPEDKRKRDLMGLLEMVQYAGTDGCRKSQIHRYFGIAEFPAGCQTCDAEHNPTTWLDAELPHAGRRAVPRSVTAKPEADHRLQRGDWIDVRGVGLCAIARVHNNGRRTRVDVEVARDLSQRSFDLGRIRWRRVER